MIREAYFYTVLLGDKVLTKLFKDGDGYCIASGDDWDNMERLTNYLNSIGAKIGYSEMMRLFNENYGIKADD